MGRNGRLWVVRCPMKTVLPASPGMGVPGQWLGPWSMLRMEMPSITLWSRPIFGMRMRPISRIGSGAYAFRGGATAPPVTGGGAGAFDVVVVASGTAVVVGSSVVEVVVVGATNRLGTSAATTSGSEYSTATTVNPAASRSPARSSSSERRDSVIGPPGCHDIKTHAVAPVPDYVPVVDQCQGSSGRFFSPNRSALAASQMKAGDSTEVMAEPA